MARTRRTDRKTGRRTARDGQRLWTTRGRRTRGELRAKRGEAQRARRDIALQLAEAL